MGVTSLTSNRSELPNGSRSNLSEHNRRLASLGVGLATTLSDLVLVYPCLVLRRRCQVNTVGRKYHLHPFSILTVAIKLQRNQGFACLWKGIGSHLTINALMFGVETGISEASVKCPREVDSCPKVKDVVGHLFLKTLSASIVMPFYTAHVVESIQSGAACDSHGLFYCISEGFSRMLGLAGVQSRRLLPLKYLLVPTVLHFVLRILTDGVFSGRIWKSHACQNISRFCVNAFWKYEACNNGIISPEKYIIISSLQYAILCGIRLYGKWTQGRLLRNMHRRSLLILMKSMPTLPSEEMDGPLAVMDKDSPMYIRNYTKVQSQKSLSNFISQLVTDILLYPFECVVHRLLVQGTRTIIDDVDRGSGFLPITSSYEGFFDCFSVMAAQEGHWGFYKGFGALILQHSLRYAIFRITDFSLKASRCDE